MVVLVNFFEQVENLEPHCPECQTKVQFGVTTEYVARVGSHVCKTCQHVF